MVAPLAEDAAYTLTVTLADTFGNVGRCQHGLLRTARAGDNHPRRQRRPMRAGSAV